MDLVFIFSYIVTSRGIFWEKFFFTDVDVLWSLKRSILLVYILFYYIFTYSISFVFILNGSITIDVKCNIYISYIVYLLIIYFSYIVYRLSIYFFLYCNAM